MSNIKEKDDNLTVSRVYDTLKSPTFLKTLYWDILSDIKEKKTYTTMRRIAEGLINQNMKGIDGLSSNVEDTNRRRAIVAEISVMSYTIDTVFSKILYLKLEKACKEQITKIIHELRQEGKIPDNVWSRINLNAEASGSQSSTENTSVRTNSVQANKEVQTFPTRKGKRRRTATPKLQDIARANANKEILDDLAKVNNLKYSAKDETMFDDTRDNSFKKRLEGMIKDDSDSDSDISIGFESVVSSVHTSDLSSFDDEISLSSDDENGQKKKASLKEVQKKYSQQSVSNSSANKKNGVKSLKPSKLKEKPSERVAEDKNNTNKVSTNNEAKSSKQFALSESSNGNELPKRTRKPNSRYSSDNILCPVVKIKERKKPIKTNGKMSNDELTPPKKKIKVDDIYGDVVTITKSINNEETSNNIKTPAKQSKTVDLFKSHSSNRSLTTRRSAPLTLFST